MTEARDWLLLTLEFQEDPIRIQKTLFKFSEEAKGSLEEDTYSFKPYNWGPFSIEIYRDLDDLVAEGLVKRVRLAGATWAKYRLTDEGEQAADEVVATVDGRAYEKLKDMSRWVKERSFKRLLTDIYEAHPEMAVNSIFRD